MGMHNLTQIQLKLTKKRWDVSCIPWIVIA